MKKQNQFLPLNLVAADVRRRILFRTKEIRASLRRLLQLGVLRAHRFGGFSRCSSSSFAPGPGPTPLRRQLPGVVGKAMCHRKLVSSVVEQDMSPHDQGTCLLRDDSCSGWGDTSQVDQDSCHRDHNSGLGDQDMNPAQSLPIASSRVAKSWFIDSGVSSPMLEIRKVVPLIFP